MLIKLRAAWACGIGVLFPVLLFHRALLSVGGPDFVLGPAVLISMRREAWPRVMQVSRASLSRWILGFAASVIIGLFVGWLRLGHVTWWALINRGCGLFLLLSIYYFFASAAKKDMWLYLRCFVGAGSLLNVFALVAVVLRYSANRGSIFFFGDTSLRLSGLMHNPNQYGGYLTALLGIQLTAVVFTKTIFGSRWIDATNVLFLFVGTLFTISRGSWLAALAAALAVPFVSRAADPKIAFRRQLLAPALVVICLTAGLFIARTGGLWPALQQPVTLRTSENTSWIYFPHSDASAREFLRVARDPSGVEDRLAITHTALQLYLASPSTMAFGLGLGGFAAAAPTTNLQSAVIIHNSFLWALVELGPIGLICVIGIFCVALWRLWSLLGTDADTSLACGGLFVALVSVVVWSLSNDGMYQRQLWFLLGLSTTAVTPLPAESPCPAKNDLLEDKSPPSLLPALADQ